MNKKQSLLWLVTAIAAAIAVVVLLFSYMVTRPGDVIVQVAGDAGKNYFTFLYHSVYDKGIWFNGMNYPYGEHIIYADGQPVLSVLLTHISGLTLHQALAIMNLAMSFSFVLAIVFTYKILLRFGQKPLQAILFACLINVCAPQVLRVQGHFALAYASIIPMLFYWSLQYHYSRQLKWVIYTFVMGAIMSFIHLYMGGMIFIWVAFYAIGYFACTKGKWQDKLRHILPMMVMAAALFVFIKVVVALTDPIIDRPGTPLHTFEYVTRIKDIIASRHSPLWIFLYEHKLIWKLPQAGEGFSYLGVAVLLVLFMWIASLVVARLKKQSVDGIICEDGFSPVWLVVGAGSLLLAMGIPFIWHLQWLMKYLSVFRQFRAIGRFIWIFYYVATILTAVLVTTYYSRIAASRKLLARGAFAVVVMLWGMEAYGFISYTRQAMEHGLSEGNEFFSKGQEQWADYLATQHYKPGDFQGVIVLPFFFIGSEKIWLVNEPTYPLSIAMKASLQMKLPIVDMMMSRTSWSVAKKQVKLVAGPYADKPMLRELKDRRPFLLLQAHGVPITLDEIYLLKASEYLGEHFNTYVYACYPDRVLAKEEQAEFAIASVLPYLRGGDTCLSGKGMWYVDHMDDKGASDHLAGTGSMPYSRLEYPQGNIPLKPSAPDQFYEFSEWFLLSDKDYKSPYVTIWQLDSTGHVVDSVNALGKESVDNNGMWFRVSQYFILKPQCRRLKYTIICDSGPAYKFADEVLIRPRDAVIVSRCSDGRVMVNNHIFAPRKAAQ